MQLTVQEIAQVVNVNIDNQTICTGVEFDSRKIIEGNLFVPLAGERDGHTFVQKALELGAVATFWSLPIEEAPKDIVVIQVKDTLQAMQQLAKYYLKKIAADVIGVTGSNGKTTTKDLIASVLAQQFVTYKTQGNYNNDIGLPYTILHAPDHTEKLVLEMGMDHANEITHLSTLAEPLIAAITMIGEAHIENLGSREGIAKAKMEIVDGLKSTGELILPADEPLLGPLSNGVKQEIKTFGIGCGDIQGEIIDEQKEATTFLVNGIQMTIPLPGSYNVTNALIAYQIGSYFGLTDAQINQGFATVKVTQNRTEWLVAKNGASILSDVYNANPTAMGLVLDTFKKLPTEGRRIAVLADMLELGVNSKSMHAAMVNHLDASAFQQVYLYGNEMAALRQSLNEKYPTLPVHYFSKGEKAQLIKDLVKNTLASDSIVLKGSNGMGLMEVVAALTGLK